MYTQFTIKHLQDYLQSIFDYYSLRYQLNGTLVFQSLYYKNKESSGCYYSGRIYLNIIKLLTNKRLKYSLKNNRQFIFTNNLEYIVSILLHELKHLIDIKITNWEYTNGMQQLSHDERAPEKRADFFANNEVQKWL